MDEIKDNENLSTNLPSYINDSKIVWGDLTDGTPDSGEGNDPVFKNQREKLAFYIKKEENYASKMMGQFLLLKMNIQEFVFLKVNLR